MIKKLSFKDFLQISFGFLLGIITTFIFPRSESQTITNPEITNSHEQSKVTKLEVYNKAQEFFKIYIDDVETYNDYIEFYGPDETEVEHIDITNRWSVFFTNGLSHFTVQLNSDLTLGNVHGQHPAIFNTIVTKQQYKEAPYPIPLFSITEFSELIKLPHNKQNH